MKIENIKNEMGIRVEYMILKHIIKINYRDDYRIKLNKFKMLSHFCKRKNEQEIVYKYHNLKNRTGKTTCPI
jgi:hypothetical protein